MAKVIVGLYDTFLVAQSVIRDLLNSNIQRDWISLLTSNVGPESGSFDEPFRTRKGDAGTLIQMGIPEEDANHYAEGMRRGGHLVAVRTTPEMVDQITDIMERHNPIDVDQMVGYWQKTGWTGYSPGAAPYTELEAQQERERFMKERETYATTPRTGTEEKIPIVEERLRVGKRETERGGVRIRSYVREQPVTEQVHLREEHVRVERHPVDRSATEVGPEAFKERVIEVTERGEEAVVGKEARVKEEVVVKKEVEERTETVRDTIRHTDVEVEKMMPQYKSFFDADREYFMEHFRTNYSKSGANYSDYESAYRYGYILAKDHRYNGHRSWNEVEPQIRRLWEAEHGEKWEKVREAIHHGWQRSRTARHA